MLFTATFWLMLETGGDVLRVLLINPVSPVCAESVFARGKVWLC